MARILVAVLGLWSCQGTTPEDRPSQTDTQTPTSTQTGVVRVGEVGTNRVELTIDHDMPDTGSITCVLDQGPAVWRQLVPLGSEWAYLPGAEQPDLEWTAHGFDDSGWSRAVSPLGWNEDETLRTSIEEAASNLWLRSTFEVDDPSAVEIAIAQWRRDDGVVIWLNGTELHRDNAPEGPITPTTNAIERASGNTEETTPHATPLDVDGVLRAGTNVIAVALLDAVSWSDASFDFRLIARVVEPPDPNERHVVNLSEPAASHRVELFGLLENATYTCTGTTSAGPTPSETIQTQELVHRPPLVAVRPGSGTGVGYTLFNHQRPCAKDFANRLYILDEDGRVRWAYDTPITRRSSIDIEAIMLDSERILYGGGDEPNGQPRILHLDGTVLHEADLPLMQADQFHHDLNMVDGEIMGLHTKDVVGIEGVTEGFGFTLYDPDTQAVSWEWDTQQALDSMMFPDPRDTRTPDNPYHANAFSPTVDSEGPAVYVYTLKQEWVSRIDRPTGEVSWRLGRGGDFALVDATGAPLPDETWFDTAHGMKAYSGDRVWLYNNGQNNNQSELMAFTLDQENRVATLDWRWTELRWYQALWGDVDELPNGNALITMANNYCKGSNHDHNTAIVEVDPTTDEVVHRLDFLQLDDSTYRSQRIDGCAIFANEAMCPELGG